MIDLTSAYIQKAHRLSLYEVDASVGDVHAGQMFQLNSSGKWIVSVGTAKAYPTLNNRYSGAGIGTQGERLEGRDDVSLTKKLSCLKGNFEIATDMYDITKTYVNGQPLHPSTVTGQEGRLAPYDVAVTAQKEYFICGFVTSAPAVAGTDLLRWEG